MRPKYLLNIDLQSFLANAPIAVAVFDRDMRYVAVSQSWLDEFSLESPDIIGRSHYEVFPELSEDLKALHRRSLNGEVFGGKDDPFERQNGDVQWLHWAMAPWRERDGGIGGLVIYSIDNTEHRRAEQALLDKQLQYRSAIETSPNGFWVLDMDGRIVDANEAYARISGFTREELIGMHVYEIDVMQRAKDGPDRAKEIQGVGFARFESVHRKKDGSPFPVEIVASYSQAHGGRYFIFVTDLTERNFKNETVNFQAEILGQMKEGIHLVQVSNHCIVFTTPVFDAMFGYDEGELIGRDVSVLNAPLPDVPPEETAALINKALEKNGSWQGEVVNIRKDGSELICWVRVSTFDHHEFGKVWVAIHEDITERKKAEYDLRKARESAYKDVLVREVHHRIKNNLQGVIGLLGTALANDRPAAESIETAIRQIKSVAVLYGLQGRSDDGTVILSELCAAIVSSAEMAIQQELSLYVPPGFTPYCIVESECVPVALILNELLTNAVKHGTSLETETVEIRLSELANRDGVTIVISNTGEIAPDFAFNKPEYLGTGLNLVVALMPRKGARIWWTQNEGSVSATLELRSPVIQKLRP